MNKHGGVRPNSGKKPEFNEPTVFRKVPVSWLDAFAQWKKRMKKKNG